MGFLHCLSKPEYLPCVNIPAPFCNLCFGKIHRPFLDFPPVSLSFVLTFFYCVLPRLSSRAFFVRQRKVAVLQTRKVLNEKNVGDPADIGIFFRTKASPELLRSGERA